MTVTLPLDPIPVPIREGPRGGYRIGSTKVLLEAFIWAYTHDSNTPQQLLEAWPVLSLAQVHAVLAYYHANRELVDAYVAEEKAEFDLAREEHNRLHPRPSRDDVQRRLRTG